MTRMEQELQRLRQLTQIDRTYWDTPGSILAGMDEVGRGPWRALW